MAILAWDFDNTLAYRDGMWTRTLFELLRDHGFARITEEDIRPHFAKGFPWHRYGEAHRDYFLGRTWWEYTGTIIGNAMLALGVDAADVAELTAGFRRSYLDLTKWHLFDDTRTALGTALGKGHVNCIVSNHVPELKVLVDGLGISAYFARIISSAEAGYEKPNPRIFDTLQEIRDGESQVFMIGDSYAADIEGAIAAGIEGILVRSENKHAYPRHASDLSGIWQYID